MALPRLRTTARPFLNPAPSLCRPFFADAGSRVQIYRSTTTDPYVNLAAEHYLLQRSRPDSVLLFLYTNAPCVVIGRNQNPWAEVDLRMLRHGVPPTADTSHDRVSISGRRTLNRPVSLVRRRSGGGTVFHDEGNTNWSVICPTSSFSRTTHADMVARVLRRLVDDGSLVRVNERHDVVQDVSSSATHQKTQTFKVSGSAYKLTRTRALHHGTCLLASTNLDGIGPLLRSPAAAWVRARGVESVPSPVRNVGVDPAAFEEAVVAEFCDMYGHSPPVRELGLEVLEVDDVERGFRELTSPTWLFGQTPQFTFSTHPTPEDPRPPLPYGLPPAFRMTMTVRHGKIHEAAVEGLPGSEDAEDGALGQALVGRHLHEMANWADGLGEASPTPVDSEAVGAWLDDIFGVQHGLM